jgi:hypothetical protein
MSAVPHTANIHDFACDGARRLLGASQREYTRSQRPAQPLLSCLPLLKVASRLTGASQVLQPNDSRRRKLTFVILRGERPQHLQQRPFNNDVPLKVPS